MAKRKATVKNTMFNGLKLKGALTVKGIGVGKFAAMMGVTSVTASNWLNNHRTPSVERFQQIESATGIPLSEYFSL